MRELFAPHTARFEELMEEGHKVLFQQFVEIETFKECEHVILFLKYEFCYNCGRGGRIQDSHPF